MISRKQTIFLVIIVSGLIILNCSPKARYSVLSTVFDGVPEPSLEDLHAIADSATIDSMVTTQLLADNSGPVMYYHPPYREKECGSCHDQGQMGKLKSEPPELCYQCHDDLSARHSFMHGPAASGYCTECHNPHKAQEEHLLLRSSQDLCTSCHDGARIRQSEIHANIGDTNCTQCHNPHGGDNRFSMQAGTCSKCHEDFAETYSFLHGPVSGEYCTSCHGSHADGKEHLLVRTGQMLCLNCHKFTSISKNEVHDDISDKDCIDCHNPHGGESRFMVD